MNNATLTAGQTLKLHAGSFSAGGMYLADVSVNWFVGGIGTVTPPTGVSTIFTATKTGTGEINATHTTLVQDKTGTITVVASSLKSIKIVEGATGHGSELGNKSLTTDETLTLHAAGYDSLNNYLGEQSVTWKISGDIGTLSPASGSSTILDAKQPGLGKITADHARSAVADDSSGDITVKIGIANHVKILSSATGNTTETNGALLDLGETLTIHASTFDADNNYINDVNVNWKVSNEIGALSPLSGNSTRLTATKSGGGVITADHSTLTDDSTGIITVYPTKLTLQKTLSFQPRSSADEYLKDFRLIGLPGASDLPVKELLASVGEPDEDWQAYWDNGQKENYKVKFSNETAATFKFSVGRAFWLISKKSVEIKKDVNAAELETSGAALIPVDHSSGWNLITNPFDKSVPWSKVQEANSVSERIYSYDGSRLVLASSFDPYVGYYYFETRTGSPTLQIPFALTYAKSSVAEAADPAIWRIKIVLSSGEFIDQTTSLGVVAEASSALDRHDFRKPRTWGAIPSVYFYRPNWDAQFSTFATDIRPDVEQAQTWEFEASSIPRQTAHLSFSGVNRIPTPLEVYFIDEGKAKYLNLRNDSLYSFTPATPVTKFSVIIGKENEIRESLSSIHPPEKFLLGKNYPNPFNPSTTIPVSIAATAEVKLAIFNLMGQEVKTLYAGTLEAGRYWFNWDGSDESGRMLSSGVFLYRLTTGTRAALTGKMILTEIRPFGLTDRSLQEFLDATDQCRSDRSVGLIEKRSKIAA
jgi:hypothetical protein